MIDARSPGAASPCGSAEAHEPVPRAPVQVSATRFRFVDSGYANDDRHRPRELLGIRTRGFAIACVLPDIFIDPRRAMLSVGLNLGR